MEKEQHSSLHYSTTPPFQPIEVAAGLIFRNGKLLITQRHAGAHLGGLWEFPGGKCEAGETFEECLVRELREELGVRASVGELFEDLVHVYTEKTVHLKFFLCQLKAGEPEAMGCASFQWVSKAELNDFRFPAADEQLLKKLIASSECWRT
jgi:mutator protein MutT